MIEVLDALTEQHAELAALVADIGDGEWGLPSRCEGWTVADVVLHLAQTDELAIASATGRFPEGLRELAGGAGPASSVDEGADRMVAAQRDTPPDELRRSWQSGADEL